MNYPKCASLITSLKAEPEYGLVPGQASLMAPDYFLMKFKEGSGVLLKILLFMKDLEPLQNFIR